MPSLKSKGPLLRPLGLLGRLNLQGAGAVWWYHGRLEATYRRGYAN